jgi:hypothetical protein
LNVCLFVADDSALFWYVINTDADSPTGLNCSIASLIGALLIK